MNIDSLCKNCFVPLIGEKCRDCDLGEIRPVSYLPLQAILNGKYIVGRILGQGGFGITYLAYDLNLEKRVAIKEYFPIGMVTRAKLGFDVVPVPNKKDEFEQGVEQFANEARVLAQLKELPNSSITFRV